MKNTNFKTKLIARILLLVLLLASALSFAGCGRKPNEYYNTSDFKYHITQEYDTNHSKTIILCAVSNNDTFNISDVTLGLIYATHKNDILGLSITEKVSKTGDKELYPHYYSSDYGEYVFAIYICDGKYEELSLHKTSNIEDVSNHLFVRSISQEDAFSEEYGYVMYDYGLFFGPKYLKHMEEITIPSEYIQENKGSFVIKLVAFCKNLKTSNYEPIIEERLVFEYVKTDNKEIKIIFDNQ